MTDADWKDWLTEAERADADRRLARRAEDTRALQQLQNRAKQRRHRGTMPKGA